MNNNNNNNANTVIDELEYLMNPYMYEKWIKKQNIKSKPNDLKADTKFYKKRIIQLTKDMIKGQHITNPVNKLFTEYIKGCIAYLKFLDTKDILQEEYEGLIISDDDLEIDESDKNVDNKLINPTYLHKQNKIEDFIDVKTISNLPESETYIPEKKAVELKTPALKKKGVKKKKGKQKKNNIN